MILGPAPALVLAGLAVSSTSALAGSTGLSGPAVLAEPAALAQPADPLADVAWRKVAFKATKLMLTARARVAIDIAPAQEVHEQTLAEGPSSPLPPRSRSVVRIDVGSNFVGRHSVATSWYRPRDRALLLERQVETGKRRRVKLERYGRRGMFTRRITPKDAERQLEPEAWTNVRDEEITYRPNSFLSDPAALFWLLSVADPEEYGGGKPFYALSKGTVQKIDVRFVGIEELKENFVINAPGGRTEQSPPRIRALHYALRPEASAEELKLLGLEGDLDLYIEERHRVPVRISGRVPPLGRVNVHLREVWLADN